MAGTAGIVQAAVHGMQRVQEIMLQMMREGAADRWRWRVRSPRFAIPPTSRGSGKRMRAGARAVHPVPAGTDGRIHRDDTEMIQASYSMIERVGQALAGSTGAMGLPASAQAGGPMEAFQAGVRQWQGAMARMTQAVGAQSPQHYERIGKTRSRNRGTSGAQGGGQALRPPLTVRATSSPSRTVPKRRDGNEMGPRPRAKGRATRVVGAPLSRRRRGGLDHRPPAIDL